jgi:hypothetical protein
MRQEKADEDGIDEGCNYSFDVRVCDIALPRLRRGISLSSLSAQARVYSRCVNRSDITGRLTVVPR